VILFASLYAKRRSEFRPNVEHYIFSVPVKSSGGTSPSVLWVSRGLEMLSTLRRDHNGKSGIASFLRLYCLDNVIRKYDNSASNSKK
jgi:hypothetical protein